MFRYLWTAGALAIATTFVGPAYAQERATVEPGTAVAPAQDPADSASDSQDIVVTASKTGAQTLVKTPLAIQAFSGETLKERGVADIQGLITSVPGATIGQETAAGVKSYAIRGVGATGTNGDTPIGYYLDEVPFTIPNFGIAPPIRFLDLERVEVLRGPQGTLYGQGSAGGTFIFRTRQPDLNEIQVVGEASTSSTKDASALNWDFSGAVSVPLVKDVLAVRVSGGISRQQGYADVYYGAIDGTPDEKNVNYQKNKDWRVAVLFKPLDRLTLTGQVWRFEPTQNYQSLYTTTDPYTFALTSGVNSYTKSKYTLYSLVADADLGAVAVTSATTYLNARFGFRTPLGSLGIPGGKFDSLFLPKNFAQEVRARSAGTGPFHWVVGGNYQNGEGPQINNIDFVVQQLDSSNNAKTENYAGFGELSYDLMGGKLVPLAGIRYYHDRRTYVDATSRIPSDINKTTWRLNLSYLPTDNLTMFVTAATGFRVNTTQSQLQAQLLQADGFPATLQLAPLSLTNYEAGVKARLFEGDVNIAANIYHIDFKGLQSGITSSAGVGGFVVLGNAHTTGLDIDFSWRTPLKGLTLGVVGNVNSSKFDDVDPLVTAQRPDVRQGAQLVGAAKFNYRLDATYLRAIGNNLSLFGNANFSQTGRRPTIVGLDAVKYELLTATVGVRRGPYEIALFGNNLTDERGPTDYFSTGFLNGPIPRTIGVRLRKSF